MKLKSCIALGAFALATTLSACGGGGGSSPAPTPTPTPTPTPAANTPPNADISTTNAVTDERQEISLSAAGSSDADGDSLTYSWSQIAGPDLGAGTQTGEIFTAQVPELTADETYTIELNVSDGQASTTQTIEVIGRKIVLAPLSTEWGTESGRLDIDGTPIYASLFSENDKSYLNTGTFIPEVDSSLIGKLRFSRREKLSLYNFDNETNILEVSSRDGEQFIVFDADGRTADPTNTQDDFVFINENENSVIIKRAIHGQANQFEITGEFTIDQPCAILSSSRAFGNFYHRDHFDNILVGRRGGGLVELVNKGNQISADRDMIPENQTDELGRFEDLIVLTEEGDYCAPFIANPGTTKNIDDVLHWLTIHMYYSAVNGSIEFPVLSSNGNETNVTPSIHSMDLDLPHTEQFNQVAVTAARYYDSYEGHLSVSLALLLTSGIHNGKHILFILEYPFTNSKHFIYDEENQLYDFLSEPKILQRIEFSGPIPSGLSFAFINDRDLKPDVWDIFMVSKDSPYAIHLKNISDSSAAGIFDDPKYIEVGFGAENVQSNYQDNDDNVLIFTYPEEGKIRFFDGPPAP